MSTQLSVFASRPLNMAVTTDVDTTLPTSNYPASAVRDKWQGIIDDELSVWERDRGELEDDEMPPASRDTIQLAIRVAERLRDNGSLAPSRVVPDAHGGIVFERVEGNLFESIRISADGSVEYCEFENCRMVQRSPYDMTDR